MVKVTVEDLIARVRSNPLCHMDLGRKTGCTIIGCLVPNATPITSSEADLKLRPKSGVIVLDRPEQIEKIR